MPRGVVAVGGITIGGMDKPQTWGNTLAIHTVWTTYLSWLPGDDRGHWSPLIDFYGQLVREGHRINAGSEATRQAAIRQAKGQPKTLCETDIKLLAASIEEVARGGPAAGVAGGAPAAAWTIYAAALHPQHVHLLLAANTEPVSRFVGRVKGKSSSRIGHANGEAGQRVWTQGFWRVFLFDWEAVRAVRYYIICHNTRCGMPADPFGWITPPPIL